MPQPPTTNSNRGHFIVVVILMLFVGVLAFFTSLFQNYFWIVTAVGLIIALGQWLLPNYQFHIPQLHRIRIFSVQRRFFIFAIILIFLILVNIAVIIGYKLQAFPKSSGTQPTPLPSSTSSENSPPTSTGTYPVTVEQASQVLGVSTSLLTKVDGHAWHVESASDVTIRLPGFVCVDFRHYSQEEIKARLKGDTQWINVEQARARIGSGGGSLLTTSATIYWDPCCPSLP